MIVPVATSGLPLAPKKATTSCSRFKQCRGACCYPLVISYFLGEQSAWTLLYDQQMLTNSIGALQRGITETAASFDGLIKLQGLLYENRRAVFTIHALFYCARFDRDSGTCRDYGNRFPLCRQFSCKRSMFLVPGTIKDITVEDVVRVSECLRKLIRSGALAKTPEDVLRQYVEDSNTTQAIGR